MEGRRYCSTHLNLGTELNWEASFMPRSRYPFNTWLSEPHILCGRYGEDKCLLSVCNNLRMVAKIKVPALLGSESRPYSLRPLTLLTAPSQLRISHHIHPMSRSKYTAYFVTPIRRNNNNFKTQSCKKEDKDESLFTFNVTASDSLVDENWWRTNMFSSYNRRPFDTGIELLRTGTRQCGQLVSRSRQQQFRLLSHHKRLRGPSSILSDEHQGLLTLQ